MKTGRRLLTAFNTPALAADSGDYPRARFCVIESPSGDLPVSTPQGMQMLLCISRRFCEVHHGDRRRGEESTSQNGQDPSRIQAHHGIVTALAHPVISLMTPMEHWFDW